MELVDDNQLVQPTPCDEWNLRTLLSHVVGVAGALIELCATGVLELVPLDEHGRDIVARATDRPTALLERVRAIAAAHGFDGQAAEWGRNAATSGAVELATHGWDVLAATGQHRPINDWLAEQLLAITSTVIDDSSRSPKFGPALSLGPRASRLRASVGARPPRPTRD